MRNGESGMGINPWCSPEVRRRFTDESSATSGLCACQTPAWCVRTLELSWALGRRARMIRDLVIFLAGLIAGVVGMLLLGGYVNG